MKRILFVDDEPRVLEAIENMLFEYLDDWALEFADGGARALEALDRKPFDVVVTDMRMPTMDGAELLTEIQARHPEVARFVLSGHAESGTLLQALPVTHQFLTKPCDANTLIKTIQRACHMQALLHNKNLRGLVGSVTDLPPRPKLYTELTKALAQEDVSMQDLAALIEQDVAISAKILQLTRSAFFYVGSECTSMLAAVSRLGINTIRGAVLSLEVQNAFSGAAADFIETTNRRSLQVAMVAEKLVNGSAARTEAFVGGILHDIGRLLLAKICGDDYVSSVDGLSPQEEEARFGTNHCQAGAYLLGLWGMPYSLMEIASFHHDTGFDNGDEFGALDAVWLASQLIDEIRIPGTEILTDDSEIVQDRLSRMGVESQLEVWRGIAEEVIDKAA